MAAGDGGAGRKRAARKSRRFTPCPGRCRHGARGSPWGGGPAAPGGGCPRPPRGSPPRVATGSHARALTPGLCPPPPPRRAGVAVLGFGEESPVRDKKTCPCASTAPPPRPQVTRSRAEEMPPQHCALWGDPQQPLGFSLLLPLEEGCR